jgi:hypothetical protein
VRALILTDFNPRGTWVTAAVYAVKDRVAQSGFTYIATVAHTLPASPPRTWRLASGC